MHEELALRILRVEYATKYAWTMSVSCRYAVLQGLLHGE